MKNYGSNHPLSRLFVTADSFGERLPDNWEAIASAINNRIDAVIAAENITEEGNYPDYLQLQSITQQADEIWRAAQEGSLPDVPNPVYSA